MSKILMIAAVLLLSAGGFAAEAAAKPKLKLLLVVNKDVVYPEDGHDYRVFDAITLGALRKLGDFEVTVSTKRDDPTLVENLAQYKVILIYAAGGRFNDPKAEQVLLDFVANGGGLVGVHATDAYHDSQAYFSLIGGHFGGHIGVNWWVRITDPKNPISATSADFQIHDEAYRANFDAGYTKTVVATADCYDNKDPIAWTHDFGKGHVFNTTLGHGRYAFNNPGFLRLVIRGIYGAAGLPPKEPGLETAREELP